MNIFNSIISDLLSCITIPKRTALATFHPQPAALSVCGRLETWYRQLCNTQDCTPIPLYNLVNFCFLFWIVYSTNFDSHKYFSNWRDLHSKVDQRSAVYPHCCLIVTWLDIRTAPSHSLPSTNTWNALGDVYYKNEASGNACIRVWYGKFSQYRADFGLHDFSSVPLNAKICLLISSYLKSA